MNTPPSHADSPEPAVNRASLPLASPLRRIALVGNPNTGKTTLFNTLTGLRHRTSNFPGTTQEARLGRAELAGPSGGPAPAALIIDLPGIYSLSLELSESTVSRDALRGRIAPAGDVAQTPDAIILVVDATNLSRNLALVGEALALGLPTIVALTMVDRAAAMGAIPDTATLSAALQCPVVACDPREAAGTRELVARLAAAQISSAAIPRDRDGLERWAANLAQLARTQPQSVSQPTSAHSAAPAERVGGPAHPAPHKAADSQASGSAPRAVALHARHHPATDRLDHILMHPLAGPIAFALIMAGVFWSVFSLATIPMGWIDTSFSWLAGAARSVLPEGTLADLICDGVISGVGATLIFLPQICLLFFLIGVLEDTGYLARAAFVADRLLRPFGLRGHAFVPLLSSHACALPGIMACRAIPDPKERLAAILVAPFMTCSARLPVYVLLTSVLFAGRPVAASLGFVACYALGITAALGSALLVRRTLLKGASRPMVMELPAYKWPSLRTALVTTWDRGLVFLKKAGTNILAICVVLWWLQAYPKAGPDPEAERIRQQLAVIEVSNPEIVPVRQAEADALDARRQQAFSFAGRLGRAVEPAFAPLGYDWRLCIGVVSSFAAREVFVSTMSVVVSGTDDPDAEGVMDAIASSRRDDGVTPVFGVATSVSLLVFYVLAMQCLPTLAVTAREAGGARWALLQLAWMSGLAYLAALIAYQTMRACGFG